MLLKEPMDLLNLDMNTQYSEGQCLPPRTSPELWDCVVLPSSGIITEKDSITAGAEAQPYRSVQER